MISTRGRYALRVMLDLAENETGSYIPLKDIAARQDVSKKYLEIIVKDMVAGGLITGASGKGGGYTITVIRVFSGAMPAACMAFARSAAKRIFAAAELSRQ